MFSGWVKKFPVNRPLTDQEREERLPREPVAGIWPADRGSLIAFNSTYAEFIDRRFTLRGGVGTILALFMFMIGFWLSIHIWFDFPLRNQEDVIGRSIIDVVAILNAWFYWWIILGREFFTYTYYPIRFNRKTRQVHVFRHNGPGGVLTVPWEQGYFHIGHGLGDKKLLDVRCHVLEGDTVKDTFVTGLFYPHKETVQQVWSFIRVYMDEDIEPLLDNDIGMSPTTHWRNCFAMVCVGLGARTTVAMVLLSPLIGLFTALRWLVFKTCKIPHWPEDIAAQCAIDPADPHRMPEPTYTGQLYENEATSERFLARHKQRDKY